MASGEQYKPVEVCLQFRNITNWITVGFALHNLILFSTFQPGSEKSEVKFLHKGVNSWTFLCLSQVDSLLNICHICYEWRSINSCECLHHDSPVPGHPFIHDTFHPLCCPVCIRDQCYSQKIAGLSGFGLINLIICKNWKLCWILSVHIYSQGRLFSMFSGLSCLSGVVVYRDWLLVSSQ